MTFQEHLLKIAHLPKSCVLISLRPDCNPCQVQSIFSRHSRNESPGHKRAQNCSSSCRRTSNQARSNEPHILFPRWTDQRRQTGSTTIQHSFESSRKLLQSRSGSYRYVGRTASQQPGLFYSPPEITETRDGTKTLSTTVLSWYC